MLQHQPDSTLPHLRRIHHQSSHDSIISQLIESPENPVRFRSACPTCGQSPPHPRLNSSENLRLGRFPPNRTPSPHAASILGHQTRSLWKCPATGGNSNIPLRDGVAQCGPVPFVELPPGDSSSTGSTGPPNRPNHDMSPWANPATRSLRSRYQRYPTGFTELQVTRTACISGVSPSGYQRYSANISRKAQAQLS